MLDTVYKVIMYFSSIGVESLSYIVSIDLGLMAILFSFSYSESEHKIDENRKHLLKKSFELLLLSVLIIVINTLLNVISMLNLGLLALAFNCVVIVVYLYLISIILKIMWFIAYEIYFN
ncbi:MAG: hypothetical protein ACK5NF_01230 [Bacilli bacterium]